MQHSYLLTAMSELVNLCFSLDEDSLCLRESFFRGLLLSKDLACHWLFITCCRRRPIQTSEEEGDKRQCNSQLKKKNMPRFHFSFVSTERPCFVWREDNMALKNTERIHRRQRAFRGNMTPVDLVPQEELPVKESPPSSPVEEKKETSA